MPIKDLYRELNRRNVIRAAITYIAVCWVILQACSIIFPALDFDQRAMRLLLIILMAGFIPWLVFAWIYEYTGSGFRKTEGAPLDESITRSTDQRMNAIIIACLSLAVILLLADRWFNFTRPGAGTLAHNSIAVLPFENLSPEDDAFFTRGITEDILTQISKIGELKVLSRFTLREYDTQGKTPMRIGEDLKVANLLVGNVRRSGNELRIGCQLIDAKDGTELWAETFDRPMENIFALQSEVAEKVALYLREELSDKDRDDLEKVPTDNLIAYNYYLKGRDQYSSYNAADNERAIENYLLALEHDPNFALALAALSGAYSNAVQVFSSRPYNYLDTALVIARRSTVLDPGSSEAWNALGLAYDNMGLYEEAKTMYLASLENNPNNASSISNLSLILKSEGELVEAIELQKKSIEIHPLNSSSYNGLSNDYRRLEMYDHAVEKLEVAKVLDEDDWITKYYLAFTHICAGNAERARPYIEEVLALDSTNLRYLEIAGELYSYFDEALSRKYFEQTIKSPAYDPRINFFAGAGIGHFLWEEGKVDSANVWLQQVYDQHEQLIAEGSDDLNSIMMLASIHAIRGENNEAIALLKNVPRGSMDYVSWVKSPLSRNLQDDPEFLVLVEEEKEVLRKMREEVIRDERGMRRLKG